MQYLNTFLALLSKTSSRDTILRLVQYLTLHSVDHAQKGATFNVYTQMRRTRKVLRFLRTIQYSTQIRKDVSNLKNQLGNTKALVLKIFTILENLFTVLFYLSDHRVYLSQLELISKQHYDTHYPRSMKMYRLQNIFGALKSILQILVIFIDGKYQGELIDMDKGPTLIKNLALEFIRNILDIFVASYYLNLPAGKAKTIGVLGMITSVIGIVQALGKK